eukprot:GHVT01007337.1.p2 GENE.GHVT01007337.1~~GHVT01007337.1.p2  ORF type:complete len:191 (+),score=19.97 GHVT01007337.1:329-901(+)
MGGAHSQDDEPSGGFLVVSVEEDTEHFNQDEVVPLLQESRNPVAGPPTPNTDAAPTRRAYAPNQRNVGLLSRLHRLWGLGFRQQSRRSGYDDTCIPIFIENPGGELKQGIPSICDSSGFRSIQPPPAVTLEESTAPFLTWGLYERSAGIFCRTLWSQGIVEVFEFSAFLGVDASTKLDIVRRWPRAHDTG